MSYYEIEKFLMQTYFHSQASEHNAYQEHNDIELYIDSNSRSSGDLADTELEANLRRHSRNFTLSPETTDYDSNCGDLDSLSNDINCTTTDYGKLYTSMPVLEDGLSSGHASDTENNVSVVCDKAPQQPQTQLLPQQQQQQQLLQHPQIKPEHEHNGNGDSERLPIEHNSIALTETAAAAADITQPIEFAAALSAQTPLPTSPTATPPLEQCEEEPQLNDGNNADSDNPADSHYGPVYAAALASTAAATANATATVTAGNKPAAIAPPVEIQEAMKEIRSALQRAKAQPDKLKFCDEVLPADPDSPVWVPRKGATTVTAGRHEDEEADTDLETDRLLGEKDFFAEQVSDIGQLALADMIELPSCSCRHWPLLEPPTAMPTA